MDTNQNGSNGLEALTTESLQSNATVENRFKLFVKVDKSGRPIKENSEKLASRIGDLVRLHCPINYADWRLVPENFKDDVWNALMAEEDGILTDDYDYAWMKGHERTDGTVHSSAAAKYEQIKAAYEKQKEEETSRSNDFGFDALVEVFGSDKGKRTLRGFSSSVSKKRAKQIPHSCCLRFY